MNKIPTFNDIKSAAHRIEPYIHRTSVLTCKDINNIVDAKLFFKCENFQKTGAFKFRGACNAVLSLSDDEADKGVATHSSGNHAAALSLAAKIRGISAHIVMPTNASRVKKQAVIKYGGIITFCEPTLKAREQMLQQIIKQSSATEIHPYNDSRIIAGQGTAALELLDEIPDLNIIIVPVGGGGLLSGTALTVSKLSKKTQVIGMEPAGADGAYRSFKEGRIIPSVNPNTIADGLLTSLGNLTFTIIHKYVDDIVTVSEEGIIRAMRLIWERMKIIIEPSAAVTLGAILENKIDISGKQIGIILSGGNVDLDRLPW